MIQVRQNWLTSKMLVDLQRSVLWLIGFFVLGLNVYAGSAPHPSVLTVQYEGKLVPVVAVAGRNPVIQVEGKQLVIDDYPDYQLQRAERFGDGEITLVRNMAYTSSAGPFSMTQRFVGVHIAAELRSEQDLKGAFATVLVFSMNLETREPEVEQLTVQGLPDLSAGKAVPVKILPGFGTTSADAQYILQVFDQTGHEVKTSVVGLAWDYFAMVDRAQLKHALKSYLTTHTGKDVEAVPFLTPKPLFDPETRMPETPLSATLKVSAAGTIDEVRLSDEIDSEARRCIFDALYGWLFYPQLKAGTPVPTEISIPLKF